MQRDTNVFAFPASVIDRSSRQVDFAMRQFEHLSGHILVMACVSLAIAATAFICVTTNLLG